MVCLLLLLTAAYCVAALHVESVEFVAQTTVFFVMGPAVLCSCRAASVHTPLSICHHQLTYVAACVHIRMYSMTGRQQMWGCGPLPLLLFLAGSLACCVCVVGLSCTEPQYSSWHASSCAARRSPNASQLGAGVQQRLVKRVTSFWGALGDPHVVYMAHVQGCLCCSRHEHVHVYGYWLGRLDVHVHGRMCCRRLLAGWVARAVCLCVCLSFGGGHHPSKTGRQQGVGGAAQQCTCAGFHEPRLRVSTPQLLCWHAACRSCLCESLEAFNPMLYTYMIDDDDGATASASTWSPRGCVLLLVKLAHSLPDLHRVISLAAPAGMSSLLQLTRLHMR